MADLQFSYSQFHLIPTYPYIVFPSPSQRPCVRHPHPRLISPACIPNHHLTVACVCHLYFI